jgi:hypothetical protein
MDPNGGFGQEESEIVLQNLYESLVILLSVSFIIDTN